MRYVCSANAGVLRASRRSRKVARYGSHRRVGVAAVEMAIMLPLLAFLFVIATDFARIYYVSLTLTNAARAGAMYASDPVYSAESRFKSVQEAALADATNISPTPAVSTQYITSNSGGNVVEVTVTHTFKTVAQFPGVPNQVQLQRRVRLAVTPNVPNAF
jgi:Flp pilus assembly protein TadG